MYCSSCGTAVREGLSYCNRCGKALATKEAKELNSATPQETSQESLVWAMVALALGGLALLIGLLAVLKRVLQFHEGLIIAFAMLAFLMLLGAESVLIWLLLRSKREARGATAIDQQKSSTTSELDEEKRAALPEPPLSVTEHTTRELDRARREH